MEPSGKVSSLTRVELAWTVSGAAELERAEDRVHAVAADVPKCAGAEIPTNRARRRAGKSGCMVESAPDQPTGPNRALLAPARVLRAGDALPASTLSNSPCEGRSSKCEPRGRCHRAGPDEFAEIAGLFRGLALVPHLGCHFGPRAA